MSALSIHGTFSVSYASRFSKLPCLLSNFTTLRRTTAGALHACLRICHRCTSNKRLASEPPGHRGTVCGHGSLHVLYRNGPSSASGTQSENAWLPNVSEASHPPGPPVASPMICLAAGSLHRGAFDPGWRTSFRGCTLPGCSTKAQLGTAMENVHQ